MYDWHWALQYPQHHTPVDPEAFRDMVATAWSIIRDDVLPGFIERLPALRPAAYVLCDTDFCRQPPPWDLPFDSVDVDEYLIANGLMDAAEREHNLELGRAIERQARSEHAEYVASTSHPAPERNADYFICEAKDAYVDSVVDSLVAPFPRDTKYLLDPELVR